MNSLPEHELLSAYLDGELTAEEQARVEQLLAGSPAARQALEEMRALSATLQSLPMHKVGEDLGPRVLRLAERRMLSEPVPAAPLPQPAGSAWRALGRRLRRPRTWLWPAVATAVALMLYLRGPEVAHLPAVRQLARAPEAAKAPAAARALQPDELGDEQQSAQQPREVAVRELAEEAGRDRSGSAAARDAVRADHLTRAMPSAVSAEETKAVAPAEAAVREEKNAAMEPLAKEAESPSASGAAGKMASGAGLGRGVGLGAAAAQRVQQPAAPGAPPLEAVADKGKKGQAAKEPELPLVVVHVGLTREAADQQVFERWLARQRVAEASGRERKAAGRLHDRAAQQPPRVVQKAEPLHQEKLQPRSFGSVAVQPQVRWVELEATRDEVLSLLGALKAQPDLVVSLPDPLQLGFGADGRSLKESGRTRAYGAGGGQGFRGAGQAGLPMGRQTQPSVAGEGAKQTESRAEPSVQMPGVQQALPSQVGPEFGAVGQDPRRRARSQVGAQAAPADLAVLEPAADADQATQRYRVRFELRVMDRAALAAEAAKPADAAEAQKPAAAAPVAPSPPAAAPPAEKP